MATGSSSSRASAVIPVADVTKTYSTTKGLVRAPEDVTFDIARGHFVSILGPSGCGKSTLRRLIEDLEKVTTGTVCVDGHEAVQPQTQLGIIFQSPLPVSLPRPRRLEVREERDFATYVGAVREVFFASGALREPT